jgi:multisubunit Na+/H+ antiporter MnhE subunit
MPHRAGPARTEHAPGRWPVIRRVIALFCWAFGVWVLLTWTLTLEQVAFGAAIALGTAAALAPLGEVGGPWRLLTPRRLAATAALLAVAAGRMVAANLRLTRTIWDPAAPRAAAWWSSPRGNGPTAGSPPWA